MKRVKPQSGLLSLDLDGTSYYSAKTGITCAPLDVLAQYPDRLRRKEAKLGYPSNLEKPSA